MGKPGTCQTLKLASVNQVTALLKDDSSETFRSRPSRLMSFLIPAFGGLPIICCGPYEIIYQKTYWLTHSCICCLFIRDIFEQGNHVSSPAHPALQI